MSGGIVSVLDALVRVLWWFWPVMGALIAVASLVVAVMCTMRRQNQIAGWLMFAGWAGMTLLMAADLLMWNFVHVVEFDTHRWISHAVSVAEIGCELAVGVALVLFRPWRLLPGADARWSP